MVKRFGLTLCACCLLSVCVVQSACSKEYSKRGDWATVDSVGEYQFAYTKETYGENNLTNNLIIKRNINGELVLSEITFVVPDVKNQIMVKESYNYIKSSNSHYDYSSDSYYIQNYNFTYYIKITNGDVTRYNDYSSEYFREGSYKEQTRTYGTKIFDEENVVGQIISLTSFYNGNEYERPNFILDFENDLTIEFNYIYDNKDYSYKFTFDLKAVDF